MLNLLCTVMLAIALLLLATPAATIGSSDFCPASADEECVSINWDDYELDKIPDKTSLVVTQAREKMSGALDLETLSKDLRRIGQFIRLAYYSVGAAGPHFTKIQIQVQRRGFEITKLCDKSALTLRKFQSTSTLVVQHLQSTYEYLLDGFDEMAVQVHSSTAKLAVEMKTATHDLYDEFNDQANKVFATLEETQQAKGDETMRFEEAQKEQHENELRRKTQEELLLENQKSEKETAEAIHEYGMNEEEEIKAIGLNIFKKLANGVSGLFLRVSLFDDKADLRADRWRFKRVDSSKLWNELLARRQSILSDMQTFVTKIRECQSDEETAQIAIESLHQAVGALKELSLVMLQASHFWGQIAEEFESLSKLVLSQEISTALAKYPVEERQKVWKGNAFKSSAITNYAQWMAIGSVCGTYLENIKKTQTDLYHYIRENPTYEECRQNLKTIASTFLRDLKSDQEAIADKSCRAEEEIEKLRKTKDV